LTTPPAFLIDVRRDGDDAILAVTGEIDMATGPILWSRIQQALDDGMARVVLDLAGTTFMDSTGVGIVLRTSAVYGAASIVIRSPQERVRRLFELTGLDRHVAIVQEDRPTA
jgi:anti-sigma B factor antagonist